MDSEREAKVDEGRNGAQRKRMRPTTWVLLGILLVALSALGVRQFRALGTREAEAPAPEAAPPPHVPPAQINRWKEAARRVEEDRGEPVGRAARVHIPIELRHYPDKRRFLAVQVAAWMEQDYPIPHDEAELALLIEKGDLVEMPPLGDHYILYGVGANATGDPLTHYDGASGAEIPLYARYDLYQDAAAEMSARIDERKAAAAAASAQAAKVPAASARRRRALLAQARAARQEATDLAKTRARMAAWYDDYDKRRLLVSERLALDDFARRLGKRPYDLDDPKDRRVFRGRMLSYLRPPARDVLFELAARYDAQFHRPLPVTSLVRTLAYQRLLGETNPNATRISIPPHTTGLAFDVYDHYMSGPEQDALMDMVAELEKDGRVESLRENRDHIHMLAFADGKRPPEALIAKALGVVRPAGQVATGEEGTGAAHPAPRAKPGPVTRTGARAGRS
jgi:uncharacterized protein DUF5715